MKITKFQKTTTDDTMESLIEQLDVSLVKYNTALSEGKAQIEKMREQLKELERTFHEEITQAEGEYHTCVNKLVSKRIDNYLEELGLPDISEKLSAYLMNAVQKSADEAYKKLEAENRFSYAFSTHDFMLNARLALIKRIANFEARCNFNIVSDVLAAISILEHRDPSKYFTKGAVRKRDYAMYDDLRTKLIEELLEHEYKLKDIS